MAKSKSIQNVNMVAQGTYPSQIVHGKDFAIATDMPTFGNALEALAASMNMSPKGAFYLLQYGYTQSMQDSIAGMAKKLGAVMDESTGEPKYSEVEVAVMIHDALRERHEAIMKGEVGTRTTGPRLKGIDRMLREVAWEIIVARVTAAGNAAKLPKKVSEQAVVIDKWLAIEANREVALTEAQRRMDMQQNAAQDDTLAALLGTVATDKDDESETESE